MQPSSTYRNLVTLTLLIAITPAWPAFGASSYWVQRDKMYGPDIAADAGTSVSLGDQLALVGAPGASVQGLVWYYTDTDGDNDFYRAPWWEIGDPDGEAGDDFGWSVDLDGLRAVIGAPGDGAEDDSGSAMIYDGTGGWAKVDTLYGFDPQGGDRFGTAVSLKGDFAVVGAPGRGDEHGAAYFFERSGSNWDRLPLFFIGTPGDRAGASVAMSDDFAVVGVPGRDRDGHAAVGAAYVFERNEAVSPTEWVHIDTIYPTSSDVSDRFGDSVAIDGLTIVVGAPGDDDEGTDAGAAYIFIYDSLNNDWIFDEKLTASDAEPLDSFGSSVAIDDDVDLILVGTPGRDGNEGTSHLFERGATSSSEIARPTAILRDANDAFGSAVDIRGCTAMVGAPGDDDTAAEAGAAYIFGKLDRLWGPVRLPPLFAGQPSGLRGLVDGIDGPIGAGQSLAPNGDTVPVLWQRLDEEWTATGLGHLGRGGLVKSLEQHGRAILVIGAVESGDGLLWPAVWEVIDGDDILRILPHQAGGEAMGAVMGANGRWHVAGYQVTDQGIVRGSLWNQDGQGGWTSRMLPGIDGPGGLAYDIAQRPDGSLMLAGRTRDSQGIDHPAAWIMMEGPLHVHALPHGVGGAAHEVYVRGNGEIVLTGEDLGADGRVRAKQWKVLDWPAVIEETLNLARPGYPDATAHRMSDMVEPWNIIGAATSVEGDERAVLWEYEDDAYAAHFIDELLETSTDDILRTATAVTTGRRIAVNALEGGQTGEEFAMVLEPLAAAPDEACEGDLDGDGAVAFGDLLAVLTAWNGTGGPEDLDESGRVDFGDILYLLARWGPCPE